MAMRETGLPRVEGGLDVDEQQVEPEVVSLTLPHEPQFLNVARIVVGGLAARLELSYESLDDLQLAVESLLAPERYRVGDDVTVQIEIAGRELHVLLGPLDVDAVARDLDEANEELTLRVVLAAVVDSVEIDHRDGRGWINLGKLVPIPATS
jgi:hypothetical protein